MYRKKRNAQEWSKRKQNNCKEMKEMRNEMQEHVKKRIKVGINEQIETHSTKWKEIKEMQRNERRAETHKHVIEMHRDKQKWKKCKEMKKRKEMKGMQKQRKEQQEMERNQRNAKVRKEMQTITCDTCLPRTPWLLHVAHHNPKHRYR